jgi:hypothetical protein
MEEERTFDSPSVEDVKSPAVILVAVSGSSFPAHGSGGATGPAQELDLGRLEEEDARAPKLGAIGTRLRNDS